MDTPLDNLQNLIFDIRGKVSDGENLELNNAMLQVHENDQYLRNELSDLRKELSDLRKRKQQFDETDRKNKRLKLSENPGGLVSDTQRGAFFSLSFAALP